MPTSATGNKRAASLAPRPHSAEHGFGSSCRSAQHGFDPLCRSAEHDFDSSRHSAEHGFTLVELMVVLAIIGLVSGAVVLAFPDPRGDLRADAERFAARAHAAQDKAVIEARDIGLLVSSDGYGFERRDRGVWRTLTDKPFEQRHWAKGATALVGEAGQARALFDPTGLVEPLDVTLMRDNARVTVRIGADGTVRVDG